MDFGLEQFKQSKLGVKVGKIITDPTSVGEMIALSKHKIPAVQAIGKPLLNLGDNDIRKDENKKHVGRWVREILEEKGWTPTGKGRVSPGNLFSTGATYEPKAK